MIKINDTVETKDGVKFTVCGKASFGHAITPKQASIIADVSCINCLTPHKTPTKVAPVSAVEKVNGERVATRASGDDDWGTIVWGQ